MASFKQTSYKISSILPLPPSSSSFPLPLSPPPPSLSPPSLLPSSSLPPPLSLPCPLPLSPPLLSFSQELIDEAPDEKDHRRNEILRRFAFHQFTQHKFEESLKNYLQIQEGECLSFISLPFSLPPSLPLSLPPSLSPFLPPFLPPCKQQKTWFGLKLARGLGTKLTMISMYVSCDYRLVGMKFYIFLFLCSCPYPSSVQSNYREQVYKLLMNFLLC